MLEATEPKADRDDDDDDGNVENGANSKTPKTPESSAPMIPSLLSSSSSPPLPPDDNDDGGGDEKIPDVKSIETAEREPYSTDAKSTETPAEIESDAKPDESADAKPGESADAKPGESDSANDDSPDEKPAEPAEGESNSADDAKPTEPAESDSVAAKLIETEDGFDANKPTGDGETRKRKAAATAEIFDALRDGDDAEELGPRSRKKRAGIITRTLKEFMHDLTKFVGIGKSATEMIDLSKSLKSGVKSFDDLITKLPVERTRHGALTIGEATVGAVRKLTREGDLAAIAKLSKSTVAVAESEKIAFAKLVGQTPEKQLKAVADNAIETKKLRPELDATIGDIDKLSSRAKADLKTVENNLMKKFKQGAVIALTVGTVYVGVDWIAKATKARKGCYMLTTINNTTTSCKIAAYSCASPTEGSMCPGAAPKYYNVTLMIIAISQMTDTNQMKIGLADAVGMKVETLAASLKRIVDEKFDSASAYIEAMTTRPTINVCGVRSDAIEGGKIPDCRMCSSSDSPVSTTFIDPNQYPDNFAFQCVTNPSILDTIADVATNAAVDLWEGVGKVFGLPLKKLAIGASVAILILLLLWLAVKFVFRGNNGKVAYENFGNQRVAAGGYVRV